MNNKNRKYNKTTKMLIILLFFSIIIIICLSIFGFNNIYNFVLNLNYTAAAAIASIVGLIYTIHRDRIEMNKSIEASVRSQSQIEFKKRIYEILSLYDQLLYDVSSLNIEYEDVNYNRLITLESISHHINCLTKYSFLLGDMEYKINYFYKYSSYNNEKYDLFITDLNGFNKSIELELKHYSDLVLKLHKVNEKYRNHYFSNINMPFDFSELTEIINEENIIIKNIGNIFASRKERLYKEALECINERETIMKEIDD